jgi:hypothetical protein
LAPETGNDSVVIEVRVRQVAQLFNSLDPSPFHERDLDDEAEEFIVGWARELPRRGPIRITVHLPEGEARIAEETDLAGALRHYFAGRVQKFERDIRELFRTGRRHLGVGVLVLVLCLAASQLIAGIVTAEPLASIISESLIIVGWVANWKPIEIYLYEWWPIRRQISLYERLRDAEVSIRPH